MSLKVWGCFHTMGQEVLLGPHQKSSSRLEGNRAPYRLAKSSRTSLERSQEPKDTGQLSPSELGTTQQRHAGTPRALARSRLKTLLLVSFTCSREDSEKVLIGQI